jgi:hypothetical protein
MFLSGYQWDSVLQDFALLDDALHFRDRGSAHAHWNIISVCPLVLSIPALTFFADQGVVAVVRVVRISYGGTASLTNCAEVKL